MLFWCSDNIWLSHANFLEIFSVLSFQRYWKHKNLIWMLNFSEISMKSRFIMRENLKRKISMYIRARQRKKPKQSHPEKLYDELLLRHLEACQFLLMRARHVFFVFLCFIFKASIWQSEHMHRRTSDLICTVVFHERSLDSFKRIFHWSPKCNYPLMLQNCFWSISCQHDFPYIAFCMNKAKNKKWNVLKVFVVLEFPWIVDFRTWCVNIDCKQCVKFLRCK